MAINPDALGATSPPRTFSWTDRDTLLYALAVGAGTADLAFVTENSKDVSQQVLPSYAVVAAANLDAIKQLGKIDWTKLLHGGQSIRLFKPLPAAGTLSVSSEIAGLQDKGEGKNAVIGVRTRAVDPDSGEPLTETLCTLVVRGAGGFGGTVGEASKSETIPDRAPDTTKAYSTREDQALLYRLCGDRNPLHSDPQFAARAGFPTPILHGLCTFGFATRALIDQLAGGDAEAIGAIGAKFTSPVFPGDVLTTSVWHSGSGSAQFRTEASSPSGGNRRVALDGGTVEYRTDVSAAPSENIGDDRAHV